MWHQLLACATLFAANNVQAVFTDEAWKLDYHHALVGIPSADATFFHQPSAQSKASLLYTLSERNVLAAINPKDGSIVWRQYLHATSNSSSRYLRAGRGQDAMTSLNDDQLTGWSAQDGRQIWTRDLSGLHVKDFELLEYQTEPPLSDVLVLAQADSAVVQRIDRLTGALLWEHHDEAGDTALQLSVSTTEVFYVSLHSTLFGSYKIRVTSLDMVSGRKTDQFTLSSDTELASAADILAVGANTASPVIAWTEKSGTILKFNVIGSKSVSSFPIDAKEGVQPRLKIHAPSHTTAQPNFLVHYQSSSQHWADVFHVKVKSSTVVKAFSLAKGQGQGAFTTTSIDANVYFTRLTTKDVGVYASSSELPVAHWPLIGLSVPGLEEETQPAHLTSEIVFRDGAVVAARCALVLASGDWVLIRNGQFVWHRLEALAHVISAAWAEPSTDDAVIAELGIEAHASIVQAYVHRVNRHIRGFQALSMRVLSMLGFSSDVPSKPDKATLTRPSDQRFGFRKNIVCLTDNGRAMALDSVTGSLQWNRALPADRRTRDDLFVSSSGDHVSIASSDEAVEHMELNATTGQVLIAKARQTSPRLVYNVKDGELTASFGRAGERQRAWTFVPPSDEHVFGVTSRPIQEPVASIGKVLGDRRVLYKYLTSNLIMLSTKTIAGQGLAVHLVDAATGQTLKSVAHKDADANAIFSSVVSENWFAYAITTKGNGVSTVGYQLIVGELFESAVPNERLDYARNSSMSKQPHVVLQTYNIAEPISRMAVTQTRQGITSRSLLAYLPRSNALVAIPRMVLDPRRPVGRAATSAEMMEGLIAYAPVIEFEPSWFLSHEREVIGLEGITASPAMIESTSLVFAYGLDVFGTRLSPSASFDVLGKDFDKVQMLATVFALGVLTLFVAPLVSWV